MNGLGRKPFIGRAMLRREDRRLLLGHGQYVGDLVLPRMLHAVLVRSPVAHARIRSVGLSRAAAAPGVVYVLSGIELAQLLPTVPRKRRACSAGISAFSTGKARFRRGPPR